jgi:hypothetical protein
MPSAATKRKQRQRDREACGLIVVPVETSHEMIAALIALGWLSETESEDRAQIGAAFGAAWRDMASLRSVMSRVDRQRARSVFPSGS